MAFFPCSLDWVRTIADEVNLYPDRATIYEEKTVAAATRDASGGIDRTFPSAWRVIGTLVPCRLSSALRQGAESKEAGKAVAEKHERIYFAAGQAVGSTSRIVITTLKRYKPGDDPDDDSAWSNPVFDVVFPQITSSEITRTVEVKERI